MPGARGGCPVKLLGVDLDGTLIRRDGVLDDRDWAALEAVRARGVALTLITGRLYEGTRDLAEQLGLVGPVVCIDGAAVMVLPDHAELCYRGLTGAAAERVRSALQAAQLVAFPLCDEGAFFDGRGAAFEPQVRSWSLQVEQVADVFELPCWRSRRGLSALIAIGLGHRAAQVMAELEPTGVEVLHFEISGAPGVAGLLLHAPGVTKGSGLERVMAWHGVRPSETAVIGDWLNDIAMFEAAGRSFAMGHAPPPVKQAATEVLAADGHGGGGVAEAVGRIWPHLAVS